MTSSKLASQLDAVADTLGPRIAVLTGAGISTDSGIPDYRGQGAPVRNPMTFLEFKTDPERNRRYWAGSHLGWSRFAAAKPNVGHRLLAAMESAGKVAGVVTQNVDGLHRQAGSSRVVELHGSMSRVRCMRCGQFFARSSIRGRLEAANPWLRTLRQAQLRPDGDAEIEEANATVVPVCSVCGGPLRPDVVFFGELVPTKVFLSARSLVDSASGLLVVGSSLAVNSGVRLVQRAWRRHIPVAIINRGPTRLDEKVNIRVEAGAGPALIGLAHALGVS